MYLITPVLLTRSCLIVRTLWFQLFVVRSHGVTGVSTYTSLPSTSPLSFGGLKTPQFMISSPEIGPIRSIKRSADESCLTVRRATQSSTVEFLLFKEPDVYEFAFYQHCKAKNARLQEFYWIGSCQLLFITNTSVEYYSVNVAKKVHGFSEMQHFVFS